MERVIDRLCSPFAERRRRGVSFSCLCPELVINGDLDELTSDLVGVSCYFQVSSHFEEPALYQAQNQYKAMVRGARERERKDSQHLPGGRTFAVDSVLKFWMDLPGWPKNLTFKRVLRFLLIASSHYHYEMDFDEGMAEQLVSPCGCLLSTVCVVSMAYLGQLTLMNFQRW